MDEKEIIIPQFGLETGELASSMLDNFESGQGLISRDEITVIIYEVDGLYLTEEEYHAYLREQSEIYQSQLEAYNEAVSHAEEEARLKADEFVASLRPDVSDRMEDYLGQPLGLRKHEGLNRPDGVSEGNAAPMKVIDERNPVIAGDPFLSSSAQKEGLTEKKTIGAGSSLIEVKPELPSLFRGGEMSHGNTQALRYYSCLPGSPTMPGLSGYSLGEEERRADEFTGRWRGWPQKMSAGGNKIITGELFEPGD